MSKGKKYGIGKRGGESFETNLPSGETCLQRALGMEDLLDLGISDELDSLSGIVQVEHIQRVSGKRDKVAAAAQTMAGLDPSTPEGRTALLNLLKDKERWEKLVSFVNRITVRAVIAPVVYDSQVYPPGTSINIVEGSLDVHDVDLQDKLAIMNAALTKLQKGVVNAEPFREERPDDVADVRNGADVLRPAVDAPGGDGEASG